MASKWPHRQLSLIISQQVSASRVRMGNGDCQSQTEHLKLTPLNGRELRAAKERSKVSKLFTSCESQVHMKFRV